MGQFEQITRCIEYIFLFMHIYIYVYLLVITYMLLYIYIIYIICITCIIYIIQFIHAPRSLYKCIMGTFRRLPGISNHQHIKTKCQPTNQKDSVNVVPKRRWENFPTTEVTDQLNTVELDFAIPLPPAWSGGAQSGPAKGRPNWWVSFFFHLRRGLFVKGQRFV